MTLCEIFLDASGIMSLHVLMKNKREMSNSKWDLCKLIALEITKKLLEMFMSDLIEMFNKEDYSNFSKE